MSSLLSVELGVTVRRPFPVILLGPLLFNKTLKSRTPYSLLAAEFVFISVRYGLYPTVIVTQILRVLSCEVDDLISPGSRPKLLHTQLLHPRTHVLQLDNVLGHL